MYRTRNVPRKERARDLDRRHLSFEPSWRRPKGNWNAFEQQATEREVRPERRAS